MRKRIIEPVQPHAGQQEQRWLSIEELAEVEITSEDAAHPIESALLADNPGEWRAAGPGKQTVRVLFAEPQSLRRILLSFDECQVQRTQEYVLRWSSDRGKSFHEIVRQQWNFNPQGSIREMEDLGVDLAAVTEIELVVTPDISGGEARASLTQMLLA